MRKEKILTEKLLKDYQRYLLQEEKSRHTIEKYMRSARRLTDYADGKTIRKQKLIQFRNELEQSYAPGSVKSMAAGLNGFLAFTGCKDLKIKTNPVQKAGFCSEDKEPKKDEYETLVRTAEEQGKERMALLIQTIAATGIRISELQYITVESVENKKAIVTCKRKLRMILIPEKLCRKLQEYANKRGIEAGEIFITRTGKSLDRSNIWREMKQLSESAGVKETKVFPHNLRHLSARIFYALEKDLVKLADVLGHTSVDTTRVYTISTYEEHVKQMERMQLVM